VTSLWMNDYGGGSRREELDFQSFLKEHLHPPVDEKREVERDPLKKYACKPRRKI
jgi:hypothetical protein